MKNIKIGIFQLFCIALGVAVLVLGISYMQKIHAQKMANAALQKGAFTVVVDPGHGGVDGGAVAGNGLEEKDFNLDISLRLRDMLRVLGVPVVMTRESDISIHDAGKKTIRQQKVSDLHNRLHLVNSNPANVLISIHQNKFENSNYSGAQVFYSRNNPLSETLSSKIQNSIKNTLQPENIRQVKPGGKNIFLLLHATVPAAVVECGFLSNDKDLENLSSETYRDKIALAVCRAYLEFAGGF